MVGVIQLLLFSQTHQKLWEMRLGTWAAASEAELSLELLIEEWEK